MIGRFACMPVGENRAWRINFQARRVLNLINSHQIPMKKLHVYTITALTIAGLTSPSSAQNASGHDTATFASGCFWCTEAIFQELKGVEKVVSGYTGGHVKNPSYREVCNETTGHAEALQITYDPEIISFTELLEVFFSTHDPTTLNRQGADVGTQYRSAIFYHSAAQKDIAERIIRQLDESGAWEDPVVTEVSPASVFYEAEGYHQDYFNNNRTAAYCNFVIVPKLEKFRKVFENKLKD